MWKRLWKNVILALCVLALVIQPVSVFADDTIYRNYSSADYFVNGLVNTANTILSYSIDTNNLLSTSPSGFPSIDAIKAYLNNHNINWSGTLFNFTVNGSTKYVFVLSPGAATSYSSQYLYYSSTSGTRLTISNNNISAISIGASMASNLQPIFAYNSTIGFPSSRYSVGYYINDSFSTTFYQTNQQYRFSLDTGYIADNTNSGSGSGGSSSADLSNIETYLANLYLQNGLLISNNFRSYTPDGTLVNGSWIGVGAYLTYLYNCMQNMNSDSVTYINQAGTTITAPNPYYYFYHQLDSIFVDISDIMLAVDDLGDTVTYLSDINDRLEAAFPSNQAAINDFIAEDLMDDTGGNGLTINRIAQSKSDLDDGLDTFKLNTSESQYSNPFSALSNADWSFWSQTTVNNLGSGYSYSFGEGSLMSEDDVFTVNQNVLLNLLGW